MSSKPRDAGRGAPFIVEFIGTPGAGKTTLAHELVNQLCARGVAAATPVDAARDHTRRTRLGRLVARVRPARLRELLLWELFYARGLCGAVPFAAERRELAGGIVRGQRRRPVAASTKRHMLFWFFQLGGRYRLLSKTSMPGEVLVVDDGFLHRSVGLGTSHLEEPDPEWVEWYVDLVPPPDLVVHVAAPADACDRRVRARGVWPHFRHLSSQELSSYIVNADKTVSLAISRARARGWTVVSVDNTAASHPAIEPDLAALVESILAEVTSAAPSVPEPA